MADHRVRSRLQEDRMPSTTTSSWGLVIYPTCRTLLPTGFSSAATSNLLSLGRSSKRNPKKSNDRRPKRCLCKVLRPEFGSLVRPEQKRTPVTEHENCDPNALRFDSAM